MKRSRTIPKTTEIDWETVCERTRQRCNKLSEEERRRLVNEALRIIYNADAQTPTGGR